MMQGSTRVPPVYAAPSDLRRGPILLILVLLASGGLLLFFFNPVEHGFYPTCMFHRTTGLLCPGCGSLRALHQLLHGNLIAALHLNALLVLSLPWIGWQSARLAIGKYRHRRVAFTLSPGWLWLALAVLLAFGLLRNLPFAQIAW